VLRTIQQCEAKLKSDANFEDLLDHFADVITNLQVRRSVMLAALLGKLLRPFSYFDRFSMQVLFTLTNLFTSQEKYFAEYRMFELSDLARVMVYPLLQKYFTKLVQITILACNCRNKRIYHF